MRDKPGSFADVLDPDESVLWLDRPQASQSDRWKSADFAAGWVFALGLSAAAFAKGLDLLPRSGCRYAVRNCMPDHVFGWVFLVTGALVLYTAFRMSMSSIRDRKSKNTESYAITDRRALLVRTAKGRPSIRSVPVQADLWIAYVPGPGGEVGISRMTIGESDDGSTAYDEEMVVFRNLANPDIPYRLLRKMQNRKE